MIIMYYDISLAYTVANENVNGSTTNIDRVEPAYEMNHYEVSGRVLP